MAKLKILMSLILSLSLIIFSNETQSRAEDRDYTTPRGVVALALLNHNYPFLRLYSILKDIPHPAIAVSHKVFGENYDNLRSILRLLDSDQIHPTSTTTVIIYADCGPCRPPRRPKGQFKIIAPWHTVASLNRALERGDRRTLAAFQREYIKIRSNMISDVNVRYIVHPSLEDNLTNKAYLVLRNLLEQTFSDEIASQNVVIGRNPASQNLLKPPSYVTESHDFIYASALELRKGDILTADGVYIDLKKKRCVDSQMLKTTAKEVVKAAVERGVIVLIWSATHQGINQCSTVNQPTLPLNKRQYIIDDIEAIKRILTVE